MGGFIAQLVEHRTGVAEVMGLNPVEALNFFRLLLSDCLNWKIYRNDHSSFFCGLVVSKLGSLTLFRTEYCCVQCMERLLCSVP